jgi:hypothetical protein
MTKIYTLTKQIHKTINLINKKYGLNIDIKSENHNVIYNTYVLNYATIDCPECYISDTGELMSLDSNYYIGFTLAEKWEFAIGEKQIREVLNDLKDFLGDDTEEYYDYQHYISETRACEYVNIDSILRITDKYVPQSEAEVLCHKWLDGLNPMFDNEAEKVLKELLETLNNLIKN